MRRRSARGPGALLIVDEIPTCSGAAGTLSHAFGTSSPTFASRQGAQRRACSIAGGWSKSFRSIAPSAADRCNLNASTFAGGASGLRGAMARFDIVIGNGCRTRAATGALLMDEAAAGGRPATPASARCAARA
jgi:hypothetical protein